VNLDDWVPAEIEVSWALEDQLVLQEHRVALGLSGRRDRLGMREPRVPRAHQVIEATRAVRASRVTGGNQDLAALQAQMAEQETKDRQGTLATTVQPAKMAQRADLDLQVLLLQDLLDLQVSLV